MSRPPESRIEPLTEARLTDLRDWCDGLLNSPNTVRQRDGENLADLISEFEGLKANYQRVCGSLQELCQKHEVGRGGEYLDEIVVREYEREAALRARYEAALREWKLRAAQLPNPWPKKRRGPGSGGAYHYGYESAWRGWPYDNIYTRADCRASYDDGYDAGQAEFGEALAAAPEGRTDE